MLHAKEGHEQDPIPGKDIVRYQFSPNNPTRLTSGKFSARFPIRRRVQTRILSKEHQDAHWVAAMLKYGKHRLCSVRDLMVEHGYAHGVVAIGADDKCMVPQGPPGLPVDAGVRAHGPVFTPDAQRLNASDHDHHRQGAIIPSVLLLKDIPERPSDSWFRGVISCTLHDAVFEKSDPFLHAACMLQLLRAKEDEREAALLKGRHWFDVQGEELQACEKALKTFFISIQADGGADHHIKNLKVRLSLLAVKLCLEAKRLDAERGCPNHSAAMIHERAMEILNLGLQHTSHARARMEEDLEELIRNASSMAEIRNLAGVGTKPSKAKTTEDEVERLQKEAAEEEEDEEQENEANEEQEMAEDECACLYLAHSAPVSRPLCTARVSAPVSRLSEQVRGSGDQGDEDAPRQEGVSGQVGRAFRSRRGGHVGGRGEPRGCKGEGAGVPEIATASGRAGSGGEEGKRGRGGGEGKGRGGQGEGRGGEDAAAQAAGRLVSGSGTDDRDHEGALQIAQAQGEVCRVPADATTGAHRGAARRPV